jgi:hypothetical protein
MAPTASSTRGSTPAVPYSSARVDKQPVDQPTISSSRRRRHSKNSNQPSPSSRQTNIRTPLPLEPPRNSTLARSDYNVAFPLLSQSKKTDTGPHSQLQPITPHQTFQQTKSAVPMWNPFSHIIRPSEALPSSVATWATPLTTTNRNIWTSSQPKSFIDSSTTLASTLKSCTTALPLQFTHFPTLPPRLISSVQSIILPPVPLSLTKPFSAPPSAPENTCSSSLLAVPPKVSVSLTVTNPTVSP